MIPYGGLKYQVVNLAGTMEAFTLVDFDKLILYVEDVGEERDRQKMGRLLNGEADEEEWQAEEQTIAPLLPTVDSLQALDTPKLAQLLAAWLDELPGLEPSERTKLLEAGADLLEARQDEAGGWVNVHTTLQCLRILMHLERLDSHPFFN